jgi:hypothetical protein
MTVIPGQRAICTGGAKYRKRCLLAEELSLNRSPKTVSLADTL